MNFKQMYVGIRLPLSVGDYRFNSMQPVPDSSVHRTKLFPVKLESTETQQMCRSPLASIGRVCFIYNQAEIVCKHVPDSQTRGLDDGDLQN